MGLAEDLEQGVIDRFRSLPMARAGVLVGFRFENGPVAAVGSLLVVALFGYALSWLFVNIALATPSAESAQSASFVFAFPLSFVSSVFVPTQSYTIEWLAWIARNSPTTAAADAARGLAMSGPVAGPVVKTVLWAVLLMVVFVPLSVRRFRRLE